MALFTDPTRMHSHFRRGRRPVEPPRYHLLAPPAAAPVTLAQVKDHLNITDADWDTKIRGFIAAATVYTEEITGRALCTQSYRISWDEFPIWREAFPVRSHFDIPKPPLQAVTSIQYTPWSTQVAVTLDPLVYRIDTESDPGRVVLRDSVIWPNDWLIESNGVVMLFTAGYGMAADYAAALTLTLAGPCVVTWTAHGLDNGDAVTLTTTGALPAPLVAGATYYVRNKTANTFELSLTRLYGPSISTAAGAQSGTHTGTLSDGKPAAMPDPLQQAIFLLIGAMFENREAVAERAGERYEPPLAYTAMVAPYRLGSVMLG